MNQQDRLTVLLEPLNGLDVSKHEREILEWLSKCELATGEGVAALLWRAKTSPPPPSRGGGTPPFDGAHPVRIALVLAVLELLEAHGYRRGCTRTLADVLRTLNALVKAYEADS